MKLQCVVEGQGDVEAVPILLRRIAERWRPTRTLEVLRPYRLPRGKAIHRPEELTKAIRFAMGAADAGLLLLDSDDDLPCVLGPQLAAAAGSAAPGFPYAVVLAEREFEAWFVAAAESLAGVLGLPATLAAPDAPSRIRDAKGWLGQGMSEPYSPVIHQPRFAARVDLDLATERSPSFDKLRREVLRLLDIVVGPT